MKDLVFIFILMTWADDTFAQADSHEKGKERKYSKELTLLFQQGTVLGNGTEVGDKLAKASYYNGFEIRLGLRINDQNDVYSQVYRFPIMGVGWYASTFNQAAIGKPNALYYYFTMPIQFEGNRKFTISYTGAFGLSYNFNPYNEISNPQDVFIGSYRNCYVKFALQANYHLTAKWITSLSLGFTHFSNGSIKLPNYGINLLPFSLSVSYRPEPNNPYKGEKNVPVYIKHNELNVAFSAGSKNYTEGEPNFLKTTLGINWNRAWCYKYKTGLGLDIFYSTHSGLRNNTETTFSNSVSTAIVGSWEWSLNKHLYVPVAFAFYLKRNEGNGERDPFYERAGLRYRFNSNLFAGITIKAHKGVADYFEWTVGYTLRHDPNKY